jgi:putative membrane protein
MILQSLAGLPAFLVCTAIIAVVAYLFVYTRVTPHNEFQLICDNDAAACSASRFRWSEPSPIPPISWIA